MRAYDPVSMDRARQLVPGVHMGKDAFDTTWGAEAVVICTEWKEFRNLDLPRLREGLARPLVVDGRNLYEPARMAALGFEYYGVGRPFQPAVTLAGNR